MAKTEQSLDLLYETLLGVRNNDAQERFYRGCVTYYVRMVPHAMVTLIVANNGMS